MLFDDFIKRIPKIEKIPLTGVLSHAKMAPATRLQTLRAPTPPPPDTKVAGVFALVFPDSSGIAHCILTERHDYQGVHAGQISFPGGKKEASDAHLLATALRETHEEIGIDPGKIRVIKSLSELYIPPSRFLVSPFLGYTLTTPQFVPDPSEVAALLPLPLHILLSGQQESQVALSTSYSEKIEVPALIYQEKIIWGATAMVLSEIKDLLLAASTQ